eukprot:CAMPEP_0171781714 /NCGR_PEP_ID=MMETSP0991-20121206/60404_1 /TAXON_ID=483369 /ORGANISM="non described non described, Strain CCMP2098" /LENGTH=365 /DNA_ID=CAMNT_0012389397 /DNA_START=189 /DNA_END=1283 /DNA_ORIENTATION=+
MDVIEEKMKAAKKKIQGLKQAIEEVRGTNVDIDIPCLSSAIASEGGHGQNDPKKLRLTKTLNGHFGKVYAMHWSGDAEHLMSASQDGKLIIWHAATGTKASAIPLRSSWVMTCAFEQSEGKLVACGGLDNLCSIYSIEAAAGGGGIPNRAKHELSAHDGYISCCRFVNNSTIISASGDSTCMLWDVETGENKSTFSGHDGDCMSIAICPTDQNLFISGACDATAKLWDQRTGECVQSFVGHESDINSVAFLSNGHAFGSASDDSTCRIFDLRAYGEVSCFANDKITCGITSLDFSKSGRCLFAGYENFTCQIWDAFGKTEVPVQCLNGSSGHDNRVSCLGVNNGTNGKGGTALCTGSWDMSLKVW